MTEGPVDGSRLMLELVMALGDQLSASAELAGLDSVTPPDEGIRRIILCGMGGSAIAGDLVQPLLGPGRVSLTVRRDYGLPHWAGPDDFVICSSYSGDTEETLAGVAEAGELGCRRLAITSGGTLAGIAAAEKFSAVILPGGLPPRASLGLGLGALVRSLGRLGLVEDADTAISSAAATLNGFRSDRAASPTEEATPDPEGNLPAAELARRLLGKIPVIYTAGDEAHAAGLRLKGQLNENSKVPALWVSFPELNHNDLVGWSLADADRGRFVLLILRGMGENERTARRVALTRELLAEEFPEIHEIRTTAPGMLDRVMSLVQYGDFLSCHLANLRQVDPLPVERISRLKEALGKPE